MFVPGNSFCEPNGSRFSAGLVGMAEMHLIVQRYKTDNFHAQDNETVQLLRV